MPISAIIRLCHNTVYGKYHISNDIYRKNNTQRNCPKIEFRKENIFQLGKNMKNNFFFKCI